MDAIIPVYSSIHSRRRCQLHQSVGLAKCISCWMAAGFPLRLRFSTVGGENKRGLIGRPSRCVQKEIGTTGLNSRLRGFPTAIGHVAINLLNTWRSLEHGEQALYHLVTIMRR